MIDETAPTEAAEEAPEPTELELAYDRYRAAMKAMASGAGLAMGFDRDETTSHGLRISVNIALVQINALASLLLSKGYFTELEWATTVTAVMEGEKERYEEFLAKALGQPVELK